MTPADRAPAERGPSARASASPGGRALADPGGRALAALIRRERLARGWALKGLAHGICAVSYLSKIERGEAEPSPGVARALLERLGVVWHDDEAFLSRGRELVERVLETVLSCDDDALPALADELAEAGEDLAESPLAASAALARGLAANPQVPVEPELESLLDERELGLQRLAQGRLEEALRLAPCGYAYLRAGEAAYESGERGYAPARELLGRAYGLAAEEGRPRVMLIARLYLGNCCCNQLDLEGMEGHYRLAARLARALGDREALGTIAYNAASAQLECGRCEEAYAYFSAIEEPSALDLHKLAIACEGTGRRAEALAALDRVGDDAPELECELCRVVRLRLEHEDYLALPEYGEALLAAFARLRRERPVGFAAFHLPWVLEWYAAHRQYRAAYELVRDFPLQPLVRVEYDGMGGVQ